MGRGRDREPRRRDFDDDYRSPAQHKSRPVRPMTPANVGEPQDAVVKWFNPEKGFGFVELSDGSGDAFLHVNAIQAAGVDTISPGTTLVVQIGQGAKGAQVSSVVKIGVMAESPPTRGKCPTPVAGASAHRYLDCGECLGRGQVVQPDQGLRIHPGRRWAQGHLRPHVGRQCGRSGDAGREAAPTYTGRNDPQRQRGRLDQVAGRISQCAPHS